MREPGSLFVRLCALALLALAVAPGVWFRTVDLEKEGPRVWDEGIYVQEARFLYSLAGGLRTTGALKIREIFTRQDIWKKDEQLDWLRNHLQGSPPIFGRVTHDAALAVGMIVWGPDDPSVGARVNAAAGVLSLGLLFLLARRLYGGQGALVSTLVFSLCGYHIQYCRSAMAETTTLLFLLPAFLFYWNSRTLREHRSYGPLALGAFFLGVSFTAHNRMLVLWGLFVLYEIALWRMRSPAQPPFFLRRMAVFHAAFFLPLAAWEFAYYAAFLVTKHLGIVVSAPTYLEQVVVALGRSALWGYISKAYRPEGFLTFPYLFARSSGLALALVSLAGFAAAVKRRKPEDLLVLGWFLVPFLFYSLTTAGLSRVFTVVLPAAALLAGGLFRSTDRSLWCPRLSEGNRAFALQVSLLLLLFANGLFSARQSAAWRDGYGETASWLRAQGAERIISTNIPVFEVYVGKGRVAASPPDSLEALQALAANGYRYYVMDCNKPLYGLYQKNRVEVMDFVASRARPKAVFENPFVRNPLTVFEANLYFWDTLRTLRNVAALGLDRIEVYDLQDISWEGEEARVEPKDAGIL